MKLAAIFLAALFLQFGCIHTLSEREKRQRLATYKQRHYEALPERAVGSKGYADFERQAQDSRLILLGDQHADVVLHRRLLHLLRLAHKRRQNCVLIGEFIGQQDEALVDDYLARRLSLTVLRKKISKRWPESWMDLDEFDGGFYRSLVQLARQRSIAVRALEPTPRKPLLKRDKIMAAVVKRLAREHPDSLLIVLVGHAHLLGRGHLAERLAAFKPLVIVPRPSTRLAKSLRNYRPLSSVAQRPAFWELSDSLWLWDIAINDAMLHGRSRPY